MKATIPLGFLLLETSVALAAKKVVHIPFERRTPEPGEEFLRKRAGPVQVSLINAQTLYVADVTIGTPAQKVQLQVDTGSSDVWVTDSTDGYCSESSYACEGGTFTPSQSSTYNAIAGSDFNISYVDNSGSTGNYFTDTFEISSQTLTNLQMGLATQTTIGTGIIGVCFEADESVCNQQFGPCPTYPSIMSQMVSQGLINSQAYSLYLDDVTSKTGSILFGGVDTDKFTGSLITIPIQKDAYSEAFTSFSVAFTGLSVSTSSGTQQLTSSGYAVAAILDSGTSLTLLPNDVFDAVTSGLNLNYDQQVGIYTVPCSSVSSSTTYNFQFGGSNGPIIKVPENEFIIQTEGLNWDCELGILPAGTDPVLFGDTFLRSAYVVYDLDNKQISMAQTDFDSTTSNVQVIEAGVGGVPSVAATAADITVVQTASDYTYGVISVTGAGAIPTAGAARLNVPGTGSDFAGVIMAGMASVAALLGSCYIFL